MNAFGNKVVRVGEKVEINTKRCRIRQFNEGDIDQFMMYRNNMDWMKYQGFKGLLRKEYEDLLLGQQSIQDGIQAAIVCKETGGLIGDLYLRREGADFWIGYSISPLRARQGYACEVATAIIRILKEEGVACIKAGVDPDNTASIALLQKLNFQLLETEADEDIYFLELNELLVKNRL